MTDVITDWRGINEFIAVVNFGTFTLAADSLGVGTSKISKRISELEDRLGVQLLHRTTRTVVPTDEGLVYYERCKDAMSLIHETEGSLKNTGACTSGQLKVIISGIHQPRLQVAILAGFCNKYPNIDLQVQFIEHALDLTEKDFDVAIVLGELNDETLNSERIATFPHCICAHPGYLKKYGTPSSPFDLENFNCIIGNTDKWQFKSEKGEFITIKVKGTWQTSNGETLLQAARYGMGLAQIPEFYTDSYIESGKLVKVLENWRQIGQSLWLVLPNRRHVPSKIKLFRDYIKEKGVLLMLENKNNEDELVERFHNMEVKLDTNTFPIIRNIEDFR